MPVSAGGNRCRDCNALLDGATGVGNDVEPSAGDWSVCAYCACLSVFTGNGRELRAPTLAELEALDPDEEAHIDLAVRMVRESPLYGHPPEP